LYRNNLALYASYGGDFQTGEREARAVQQLDPSYTTGYMALAFAQLGQGQPAQAAETYRKIEAISKLGVSKAASGLGDLALYEGRLADAARILQEGANEDLAAESLDKAGAKLVQLAYSRLLQGQRTLAATVAETALKNSQTFQIRFLAGRVFAGAGQNKRAQDMAASLKMELQAEPQAYAKIIEGQIKLQNGGPRDAIQSFIEANRLFDTWIGRLDLGRSYLEAGAFAEADSEFDRCLKRRGEALALFLDEEPTYGYFPVVYYYLGRAREGLKSQGYAEFYRTYLSIREKAGEDPLLAEVRKRAGR
jgi:tetratricopeptide (TPR) repeat protein